MTIIIGAGPAGLGAALALNRPALILERNSFAGKKLLLSGSGQCNVTNAAEPELFLQRLGDFRNFLKPAFYALSNRALMDLLEAGGCPLWTREDGKVFPVSMHSSDVRNCLLNLVQAKGHTVEYGVKVTSIKRDNDGFSIQSENGRSYLARKLILAGGGASYPETGSDANAYSLARALGHTIVEPHPALAPLRISDFGSFVACAGITLKGIQLKLGKKGCHGDLLFTHQGFSGPVILDNSYRINKGDTVSLVFDASGAFPSLLSRYPKKKLSSVLHMLDLPHSLCAAILKHLGVADRPAADLRAHERKQLQQWLPCAPFRVQSLASLAESMSDYGGVALKEVKASTLESQIVPGLYPVGETLAYSLPTGGFSIQMAFSTGFLAGKNSE